HRASYPRRCSWVSLGLNVLRALLDDETQPMPLLNHVRHAVNNAARPWNLWASCFGNYIVRPLSRPPGQFAFLQAFSKVCLPWNSHLFGNVSGLKVSRIETKRL